MFKVYDRYMLRQLMVTTLVVVPCVYSLVVPNRFEDEEEAKPAA